MLNATEAKKNEVLKRKEKHEILKFYSEIKKGNVWKAFIWFQDKDIIGDLGKNIEPLRPIGSDLTGKW